jgi:MYXO-CTERM domain-containing protein
MRYPASTKTALLVGLALAFMAGGAEAATLSVGPGATYATIPAAMAKAKPGDIVEVQGGQTYRGTITFRPEQGGMPGKPITVRGIPVNGQRPILTGVGTGEWDTMVVLLNANHFVMESFEVAGDGTTDHECVINKADDVLLRDFVIHDCHRLGGLFATDTESGSITVEYSEFFHNGDGDYSHQLYMATDEDLYPGSVFRMQFCYVHDATGGNSVQSRAQRNEIYYNWIEGAMYHELDLIGADGAPEALAREDSDIVGNVLVKTSSYRIARIGGDGAGNSAGRYRFVNNTMILADSSTAAIGLQETVQSLEMYNNVIYASKSGFRVYRVDEPSGPATMLFGSNNWVLTGTSSIPTPWTATLAGSDPRWVNAATHDLRPAAGSPLIGAGTTTTSAGAAGLPSPLALPAYAPPQRRLLALGTAETRTFTGTPALGAFEQTAGEPGPSPATGGTVGGLGTGGSGPSVPGSGAAGGNAVVNGSGSGCTVVATGSPLGTTTAAAVSMLVLLVARRRRRRG